MEPRITLPGTLVLYLETTSADGTLEIRAAAGASMKRAEPDELWRMFQANSADPRTRGNFSSKPLGNSEDIYTQLIGLPPAFSAGVLKRYHENGFIEERDIIETYQQTVLR